MFAYHFLFLYTRKGVVHRPLGIKSFIAQHGHTKQNLTDKNSIKIPVGVRVMTFVAYAHLPFVMCFNSTNTGHVRKGAHSKCEPYENIHRGN
jgi:hypothetical protein